MVEAEGQLTEVIKIILPILGALGIGLALFGLRKKPGDEPEEKLSPEDEIRKLQKQPLRKRYKRG